MCKANTCFEDDCVLLKRSAKMTPQSKWQAFLVGDIINAAVIAKSTTVSKYEFWLDSTNNFARIEAEGESVRTRMIVRQFRYLSREVRAYSTCICIKQRNCIW